jgi:hypothetical protein
MAGGNGQIVAAVAAVKVAPRAKVQKRHATKGLPPRLGVAGVAGVESGFSGMGPSLAAAGGLRAPPLKTSPWPTYVGVATKQPTPSLKRCSSCSFSSSDHAAN